MPIDYLLFFTMVNKDFYYYHFFIALSNIYSIPRAKTKTKLKTRTTAETATFYLRDLCGQRFPRVKTVTAL